ncbi:hypothetical protein E2562_021579 [Oryza meyeriana var. granulata]|uniref:Uncharacterized protein n=1 Tax=Oryza meyeriana var. granulata TaxID=110450 RepID=A0A6G1EY19_9ORYZ|nr:hypothetical protein E2562_021579 [Oryza meyeriana var. granulata]
MRAFTAAHIPQPWASAPTPHLSASSRQCRCRRRPNTPTMPTSAFLDPLLTFLDLLPPRRGRRPRPAPRRARQGAA